MFSTFDWYDYVRLITTAIAYTALYVLGQYWYRHSAGYSRRRKHLWFALNALLIALGAHNLERVALDRALSYTVFLDLAVSILCLKAAFYKDENDFDHDPR